jgi:hypothetical protein
MFKLNTPTDDYYFENYFVKLPKEMNSFNTLLDVTKKQTKQMLHDGITIETMREASISKLFRIKTKLKLLSMVMPSVGIDAKTQEKLMEDKVEFAHGVIVCAYLKACKWGDDFGIMLNDGTMPLLPKEERSDLFHKIAKVAEEKWEEIILEKV